MLAAGTGAFFATPQLCKELPHFNVLTLEDFCDQLRWDEANTWDWWVVPVWVGGGGLVSAEEPLEDPAVTVVNVGMKDGTPVPMW